MTRRRIDNYLWISWLSKLMTGEAKCLWSSWFRVHYMGFVKVPSDFQLSLYQTQHTQALVQFAGELEAQGQTVYTEGENEFRLKVADSPKLVLCGRPDLVAIDQVDGVCVYDIKTGRPKQSDEIQVLLYSLCLPSSTLSRCHDRPLRGAVVYRGAQHAVVPVDGIDQEFRKTTRFFVDLLNSDVPPKRSPGGQQCRYCDISVADCEVRVERSEEESGEPLATLDWDTV